MSGRVLGFRLVVAVGFVVAVGLCFFFVCLDWIWFANDFFWWFAGLSWGAAIGWFFDDRFFGCFATEPRDGREEKGEENFGAAFHGCKAQRWTLEFGQRRFGRSSQVCFT